MAQYHVTSREVANLAGVSQSTVSIVLTQKPGIQISEAMRGRVLEAARQLGYHPNASARALVRQQTQTVGLIVRESAGHTRVNAFLPPVIEGITSVAGAADFNLQVQPIEDARDPEACMKLVLEAHVDGSPDSQLLDTQLVILESCGAVLRAASTRRKTGMERV